MLRADDDWFEHAPDPELKLPSAPRRDVLLAELQPDGRRAPLVTRRPLEQVDTSRWPAWALGPGAWTLPPCRWCSAPLVWRGSWDCDACGARHAMGQDYDNGGRIPLSLPREALVGVPPEASDVSSPGESDNSTDENRRETEWRRSRRERRDGVEALSSFSRHAQAVCLLHRGTVAAVDGPALNDWHRARASSLATRFERVDRCGELILMAQHRDGRTVPVESSCGDWRVCHRCRERRRYRLQRDGEEVARLARQKYRLQTGRWYRGPEGRWSERMVTCTVPHSGDVAEDARVYREAWPLFVRRFRRHFRRQRGVRESIPWRRALEVAHGGEGPHFHGHVWMLSPFVDTCLIHVWWGQSLMEAGLRPDLMPWREWSDVPARDPRVHAWLGFPPGRVPWPVAHVTGGDVSSYVAKVGLADYVTKVDGVKASLAAPHAAAAYGALSGLRVVQWAAGWAPRGEASGWHVRRATDAERAEWYARIARASGVASARNCVDTCPPEPAETQSQSRPWSARDGPKMATAPMTTGNGHGAAQTSLSWGVH